MLATVCEQVSIENIDKWELSGGKRNWIATLSALNNY
jgi:hypothetical protein